MATTTQNLGLIKPAGTDKIRIAQINSNMDTLDTKIGPVGSTPLQTQAANAAASISASQRSIAIIVDGDTAGAAVAPGSYAYIKNNTHGLAEGLYKNKSSSTFPTSGGTADSTTFEAVSGGGLNSLNSNMTDIGNKLLPVLHDANTDRNVDANRTTEMEFLRTNYFMHGYHFAMTRYASGKYHGYIYVGGYNNIASLFIEIPQDVDGKLVVWRRYYDGTYSKAVVS